MSRHLLLREWQRYTPESTEGLRGLDLDDPQARDAATRLGRAGRLAVTELRGGLCLETTSWVGRVRLGALHLTIAPKLQGMPLVRLLRYAYQLRDLELHAPSDYLLSTVSLDELLIAQLLVEAEEILNRGLRRTYTRHAEELAAPRGRLVMEPVARRGGVHQAALPCVYHALSEDQLLNQVLKAGLDHASRATSAPHLAAGLKRLVARLETASAIPLTRRVLRSARERMTRLDHAYEASITLIELLIECKGPSLESDEGETAEVPGLLFDMNRFFQRLVTRFLREHLDAVTVMEEHTLQGMLRYREDANPRDRRAPSPRPDLAIRGRDGGLRLFDAKYRDLWTHSLPREILYQLAVYAMSQGEGGEATILFPTLVAEATASSVDVLDPLSGRRRATITLRPVRLMEMAQLLADTSVDGQRRCRAFAQALYEGEGAARRD